MTRFLILFFFISITSFAQVSRELSLASKIENVTIFLNGAQVTRTAKTSLETGSTVLIFKGISQQIDKNSIQVKGAGKFTVKSIVHQLNNKREEGRQVEIVKIETDKQILEEKIKTLRNNLAVYKREEEMLVKNQNVGGTATGLKVADFKEAIEFQRLRMQEVLNKQLEFEREIGRVEKEIKKVNKHLTEATISKDLTTSDILVTISSQENIPATTFSMSYFVKDAAWKPTYDVRVEQISDPINLAYKASVYQFSGEDWKDVKLRLSTANPNQNGTPPALQTWYWGKINDYGSYYNEKERVPEAITEVSGQVKDKEGAAISGASVMLNGSSLGTITDADGFYRLNIPPNSNFKIIAFAFIGYNPKEEIIKSPKLDVVLLEDVKELQEVVVMGVGQNIKRSLTGALSGISVDKNRTIPIEMEERDAPTSQFFDFLTPYSIPSDGKVYTVEIKEETIPAVYEYYAVPKIDRDAFLTAHVINPFTF